MKEEKGYISIEEARLLFMDKNEKKEKEAEGD